MAQSHSSLNTMDTSPAALLTPGANGNTPFHEIVAIYQSADEADPFLQYEKMQEILDKLTPEQFTALMHKQNNEHETILHKLLKRDMSRSGSASNNVQFFTEYLVKKIHQNDPKDSLFVLQDRDGNTPLHVAAMRCTQSSFQAILNATPGRLDILETENHKGQKLVNICQNRWNSTWTINYYKEYLAEPKAEKITPPPTQAPKASAKATAPTSSTAEKITTTTNTATPSPLSDPVLIAATNVMIAMKDLHSALGQFFSNKYDVETSFEKFHDQEMAPKMLQSKLDPYEQLMTAIGLANTYLSERTKILADTTQTKDDQKAKLNALRTHLDVALTQQCGTIGACLNDEKILSRNVMEEPSIKQKAVLKSINDYGLAVNLRKSNQINNNPNLAQQLQQIAEDVNNASQALIRSITPPAKPSRPTTAKPNLFLPPISAASASTTTQQAPTVRELQNELKLLESENKKLTAELTKLESEITKREDTASTANAHYQAIEYALKFPSPKLTEEEQRKLQKEHKEKHDKSVEAKQAVEKAKEDRRAVITQSKENEKSIAAIKAEVTRLSTPAQQQPTQKPPSPRQ